LSKTTSSWKENFEAAAGKIRCKPLSKPRRFDNLPVFREKLTCFHVGYFNFI